MKFAFGISALALVAALSGTADARQQIKIGFVGAFSGPASAFGEDMYRSMG